MKTQLQKTENTDQVLPYNEHNVLLNKQDIIDIFKDFDLSIEPVNIDIYRNAMVHVSYCCRKNENFENGNTLCPESVLPLQEDSNERLEYLGDAVIALITAKYLFVRYPDRENEGFLTKMRTKIVNGDMLAKLCSFTKIPKFLIISQQIEQNHGRQNKKILEDSFEAFLGAMFMDFSENYPNAMTLCEEWFINLLEDKIDFSQLVLMNTNYKDVFLKYFQHSFNYIPKFYEISNEITCVGKKYDVCIKDNNNDVVSVGTGSNKKLAENDAALNALKYYGVSV